MAEQSLTLSFNVYRDNSLLKSAEFTEESVTIGSGGNALLSVEDDQLAELHAVVNVEPDGSVQLLDLGSEQGTTVNGKRIVNTMLASGDAIQVGSLRIVLNISAVGAFDEEVDTQVGLQKAKEAAAAAAVAAAGAPTPAPMGDDSGRELADEDVMDFIMRFGTAKSNLGIDPRKPKVLEVNQIWGNCLLDSKHFPRDRKRVTIGASVGWMWSLLGRDIGWVPGGGAKVLPYFPPMWSEVRSDWRNDFYASDDSLPAGLEHNLFESSGKGFVANVHEDWEGFAEVGEERLSLDELVQSGRATRSGTTIQVQMDEDVRLVVDIDGTIFFGQMVQAGKRVIAPLSDGIDYPFLGIFTLLGFAGLIFGILMALSPPRAENEMIEIPDRFVDLLLEKPEVEQIQPDNNPSANPDAGEGAKAKRDEGKVGKKEAKMDRAKGNKVEMQRQELDRQIAENAGVLGALRDGAEMEGVFGSSGLSSDIAGGIGGLIGAKGTQIGSGGLGSRGSGLGGGGTAEGLGGLGTKGTGSGSSGYGSGGGNFGAKGSGGIGRVGGDPIIMGALDRSLIDEVIKRHMNQIKYCYQRELTKDPSLSGKIVIKFVIAKDGTVSSAETKSTTMNSSAVENCIVGRFMRFQFPEPRGGGIVIVSYPFLFSPG